jgi:hypothetical protein
VSFLRFFMNIVSWVARWLHWIRSHLTKHLKIYNMRFMDLIMLSGEVGGGGSPGEHCGEHGRGVPVDSEC